MPSGPSASNVVESIGRKLKSGLLRLSMIWVSLVTSSSAPVLANCDENTDDRLTELSRSLFAISNSFGPVMRSVVWMTSPGEIHSVRAPIRLSSIVRPQSRRSET